MNQISIPIEEILTMSSQTSSNSSSQLQSRSSSPSPANKMNAEEFVFPEKPPGPNESVPNSPYDGGRNETLHVKSNNDNRSNTDQRLSSSYNPMCNEKDKNDNEKEKNNDDDREEEEKKTLEALSESIKREYGSKSKSRPLSGISSTPRSSLYSDKYTPIGLMYYSHDPALNLLGNDTTSLAKDTSVNQTIEGGLSSTVHSSASSSGVNSPTKGNLSVDEKRLLAPSLTSKNKQDDGASGGESSTSSRQASSKSAFNRYFSRVTSVTWFLYFVQSFFGLLLMIGSLILLHSDPNGYLRRPYSFFVYIPSSHLDSTTELLRWGLILVFLIGLRFFIFRMLDTSPFVLKGLARIGCNISERSKSEFIHFLNLRVYLSWALFLFGTVIFCLHLFDEAPTPKTPLSLMEKEWTFYCCRIPIAVFIFALYLFLRKWLMQRITIAFHRVHYHERVAKNNESLKVISSLKSYAFKMSQKPYPSIRRKTMMKVKMDTLGLNSPLSSEIRHSKLDPSRGVVDANVHDLGADSTISGSEFEQITKILPKAKHSKYLEEEKATLDEISDEAIELAHFIFSSLRPQSRPTEVNINIEDFKKVFTDAHSLTAFSLVDNDGNGDVTLTELTRFIMDAFIQRDNLIKALEENIKIMGQLELFFTCLFLFFYVITCLPVFDFPWNTLMPVITTFLAAGFAFGPTASKLLLSIIFIFITHPYDIGDRITFDRDTENIIVDEISLLTTTCIRTDGKKIYLQNSNLGAGSIQNIRRSTAQSEDIILDVPSTTPMEKLYSLKEKVCSFLDEEARDYNSYSDSFSFSLLNPNTIRVIITLEHKSNFQDYQQRIKRKNKFDTFFLDAARSLGIVPCK